MEAILDNALIDHLAMQLSSRERADFRARITRLRELPDQDTDLAEFLTNFADLAAHLYAASTVAIWFRTPNQEEVVRKVAVGWSNLSLDEEANCAHESLMTFAFSHIGPLVVNPYSAPKPGAGVSNPTDSFLLLAPVHHEGQELAVIELALGPKPLRHPHLHLVQHYLEWLVWLAAIFQRGVEQRFIAVEQPLQFALAHLAATSRQVDQNQERIRQTIETSLQRLAGQTFGSFAANQALAKQVHELLDSKGLRVQCPECKAAAILRCQKSGNSKTGAFVFDHYLDTGRTFHGGPSTLPRLVVVAKPPRRKSQ